MFYHKDLKTIITVVCAFTVSIFIGRLTTLNDFTFGIIFGAFIPLLDGLIWGKDRWDQHPILYLLVGALYVVIQFLIGREHRIESAILGGIGMFCMQAFLYYLGKSDKSA